MSAPPPQHLTYREHMRGAQREYWRALLTQTNWNVSAAGRISELTRSSIYKRLHAHGLAPPNGFKVHRGRWS